MSENGEKCRSVFPKAQDDVLKCHKKFSLWSGKRRKETRNQIFFKLINCCISSINPALKNVLKLRHTNYCVLVDADKNAETTYMIKITHL